LHNYGMLTLGRLKTARLDGLFTHLSRSRPRHDHAAHVVCRSLVVGTNAQATAPRTNAASAALCCSLNRIYLANDDCPISWASDTVWAWGMGSHCWPYHFVREEPTV